jgi:predicted SnoaL-like aldol condensation-catalyzing enzyme
MTVEKNKQVVRDFCEIAFNAKKPADAARQFIGDKYIQPIPRRPTARRDS